MSDMPGLPDLRPTATEDLLPTVVPRWAVEGLALQGLAEGYEPPRIAHGLIAEHFAVCIIRAPEGTRHAPLLRSSDLQARGLTWREAYGLAMENAERSLVTGSALWFCLAEDVWEGRRPDEICARQLLFPAHFEKLAPDGDPVVIIARRDRLYTTGAANERGLVELARQAETAMEAGAACSGIALVWQERRWRVYLPPEGHPARSALERLAARTKAADYAAQGHLLQAIHADRGDEVSVAPYCVAERGGRCESYCPWDDVASVLLPRADKILFIRRDAEHPSGRPLGLARWDQVVEVLAHRMHRVEGLWPERWRTTGTPMSWAFDRLDLERPDAI